MRWGDVLPVGIAAWLMIWWWLDRRRRQRAAPAWVRVRNDGRVVEFTIGCSCGLPVTGVWPAEEFVTPDRTPRSLTCGSCHRTFHFLTMVWDATDEQ